MLELSRKYALADEAQKTLLAAAGEALLVRGEHGTLGVFFSFLLPTLSALVFSFVMLQGKVFNKANAYVGILGNALMLVYIVMFTIRLFRLGTSPDDG